MTKRPAPVDEDASRNPANAEIFAAFRDSAEPEGLPAAPRRRAAQKRPGPDSNMGLAMYFNDLCPPPSWAHGMQLNSLKGLAGMFREMREHGMTPDTIRAVVDTYFSRLGDRVPRSAYWLDFKGRRWALLKAIDDTGSARTGGDYTSWEAQPDQAAQDFANGWQNV
jgi:hypothetical protein